MSNNTMSVISVGQFEHFPLAAQILIGAFLFVGSLAVVLFAANRVINGRLKETFVAIFIGCVFVGAFGIMMLASGLCAP